MQIFISSTYLDLAKERQRVFRILGSLPDMKPIWMEDFQQNPIHPPLDVCLKHLSESDAMVLLIGSRYGSLVPGETFSFTEVEYEIACAKRIPIFVFVKVRSGRLLDPTENDPATQERFRKFRDRVQFGDETHPAKHRRTFSQKEQLGEEFHSALRVFEEEHGRLSHYRKTFVSSDVFFKPSDTGFLCHHSLPLVARNDIVEALNAFVVTPSHRVTLLSGRGGLGKSKLLYEFARAFPARHPGRRLLFLREDIAGLAADTGLGLPRRDTVLVVDDAHRLDDQSMVVLSRLLVDHPHLKIILAHRPHRSDYIRSVLARQGIDPDQLFETEDLAELRLRDRKKLAGHLLGSKKSHLVDAVTHLSGGSPLVLVVASQIVKEDETSFSDLEKRRVFQDFIFGRFQEELQGRISANLDPSTSQKFLQLVAAFSPIVADGSGNEFFPIVEKILSLGRPEVEQYLGEFERVGLLVRRGSRFRIAPDVLSDHILRKVCVTSRGRTTGFAESLLRAIDPLSSKPLLTNLAEINWRERAQGQSIDLLSEAWKTIRERFISGDAFTRRRILESVESIAPYEPDRALDLIEAVLPELRPTLPSLSENSVYWYAGPEMLLHSLPGLLKRIALNPPYLERVFELLWELGRQDKRDWNSTGHPIQSMRHLAEYNNPYSRKIRDSILTCVERWLKDPHLQDYAHSPLDILDPLLAREVTFVDREGFTMFLEERYVLLRRTRPLRRRAFKILKRCGGSCSVPLAHRAVTSLFNALRGPMVTNISKLNKEEQVAYQEDQTAILKTIEHVVLQNKNPLIHQQIRMNLESYLRPRPPRELHAEIAAIHKQIPRTLDIDLYQILIDPWEHHRLSRAVDSTQKRGEARLRGVAARFRRNFRDSQQSIAKLENCLSLINSCRLNRVSGFFIKTLAEQDKKLAFTLARHIIAYPQSPLTSYFGSVLYGISKLDRSEALRLMHEAIDKGNGALGRPIALGYAWGGLCLDMEREDIAVIRKLTQFPIESGRREVAHALWRFPVGLHKDAIQLLLDVDFAGDATMASEWCGCIDENNAIHPRLLTSEDLERVLGKLFLVPEFSHHDYTVGKFISLCAERIPEQTVTWLFARIDHAVNHATEEQYRYVPFLDHEIANWIHPLPKAKTYRKILSSIRERSLDLRFRDSHWLSELFAAASENFGSVAMGILREWLRQNDLQKCLAIGLLVKKAPSDFVFKNSAFVSSLIEQAFGFGMGPYKIICYGLRNSAIAFGKSGKAGQPFPEDISLRDQALVAVEKFPAGGPTWKFYQSLIDYAQSEILRTHHRHEEMDEEY